MTENQTTEPADEAKEATLSSDEGDTPPTDAAKGVVSTDTPDEPETFPAEYVKQLRKEAADNRVKAKAAESLQREVFGLRVAALGKLHDASDMPFDPALLDDPDKLAQAVDELVARKPYLARQEVRGTVGQGAAPATPSVSLIDALRG